MPTKNFDQGALVRVFGVFTNSAGTAIDPTTVKIAYRADAIGTTTIWTYGTDAQVIRSATGTYYADIDSNEAPGRYEWNIYSVGTGQAADNGDFYIRRVLTTVAPPSDPMTTLNSTNVTYLAAGSGAVSRSVRDRLRDRVSVKDFGAVGDVQRIYDANMTSGSAVLTSATGYFTAGDVGKSIIVTGAGASSATLATTVASYQSATQITLTVAASTTATNVMSSWGTDDTTAFTNAIGYVTTLFFGATILVPRGVYGLTTLRLRYPTSLVGEAVDASVLVRLGLGSGGDFVAMTSGHIAQSIYLKNLTIWGCGLGSNVDCVDLGTETPGTTDFAYGSVIEDCKFGGATGAVLRLRVNGGIVSRIWLDNDPDRGLSDNLSAPNSQGLVVTGTDFHGDHIGIQNRYEAGDCVLTAGASHIRKLHFEPTGAYASSDLLAIGAADVTVNGIYVATGAATRRDIVRITAAIVEVTRLFNDTSAPVTATNIINDTALSYTIASNAANRFISSYSTDQSNEAVYSHYPKFVVGKRFETSRGTNTASTTNMTLPVDGNFFAITGTSTINTIATADWVAGSVVHLYFTDAATVAHGIGGPAGFAAIYLNSSTSFVSATTRTMLSLLFDSGEWQEIGRKVP